MNSSKSVGLRSMLDNPTYAEVYARLTIDVQSLTPGDLRKKYQKEYGSWRNRKYTASHEDRKWAPEMNSFSGFLLVNGTIPSPSWTLDRVNPNGGYELENMRWASKTLQTQNRTNSRFLMVDGEAMSLQQIAVLAGLPYDTVRIGVDRYGEDYARKLVLVGKKGPANSQVQAPSPKQSIIDGIPADYPELIAWDFPPDEKKEGEDLYATRLDKHLSRAEFYYLCATSFLPLIEKNLELALWTDQHDKKFAELEAVKKACRVSRAFLQLLKKNIYIQEGERMRASKNLKEDKPPDWDPDFHYRHPETRQLPWTIYKWPNYSPERHEPNEAVKK